MSKINFDNIEKSSFIEESIRILHEAYISKKLVLFVGAGADVSSGLPLWPDAIKEFCDYMHIESDGTDTLKVPQYYYNSRGNKEYVELCRKIFCYKKELPINKIHKKIVDLNVNTVITTNYTDFIEREMNNRGHIYRVICQDKDLPYAKNENLIIKMHGDFEHGNFVLKEDDYLRYSDNFRLIEIYIKSIIAKNVVLFVGYSFNDPDVKQLFSWVKGILGSDFQHAYMLEGYKDYEENIFEYYKNLGVNVIYTNTMSENKEDALLEILERIMTGNRENISNVNAAKNYFLSYSNMNYIMERYLRNGLYLCNLQLEIGNLDNAMEGIKGKSEAADELLVKLSKQLSTKASVTNDVSLLEIINALRKSGVRGILIKDSQTHSQHKKLVPVKCFEDQPWFCSILEFDYNVLKKIVEDNEVIDDGDEQFYLQQAYIYYILEEYAKSYKCLCDAAKRAFYNQKYYMYYIAQFNKYRIKDYIKYNCNVSENVRKKIEDDLEKIDLDNIILNIPDLSSDDNKMLKDIGNFQLHYSLFQDAYRISEKVKKQQNTIYIFHTGIPNYIVMQWMIMDYYKYLVYNYLMIDQYQESKEVLILYVKSILESVCTPDKKRNETNTIFGQTGNVHATLIGKFELFLMIKYMSEKDILDMITKYQIYTIPIEDDCNNYIRTILNNLRLEKNFSHQENLWNCIVIIPYINPNVDLVEDVLDCISEKFDYYVYSSHQEVIHKVLHVFYKNKNFKQKQNDVFKIEDYALGRFLKKIIEEANYVGGRENQSFSEIILEVSSIYYDIYQEYYDENITDLINVENNLVIAKIYSKCSKENKKIIKKHFENWTGDKSWESFEIYYYITINAIIEPNECYEQSIFDYLNEIKKGNISCYSNDYRNILTTLYNLYINEKLNQIDKFKTIVKESDDIELKFLSDMDGFDYNKFNLEWLKMYNGRLLDKISSNKIARYEISKIYANKVEHGEINMQLLRLYFKYFTNTV